jgi:hypothetical protein
LVDVTKLGGGSTPKSEESQKNPKRAQREPKEPQKSQKRARNSKNSHKERKSRKRPRSLKRDPKRDNKEPKKTPKDQNRSQKGAPKLVIFFYIRAKKDILSRDAILVATTVRNIYGEKIQKKSLTTVLKGGTARMTTFLNNGQIHVIEYSYADGFADPFVSVNHNTIKGTTNIFRP